MQASLLHTHSCRRYEDQKDIENLILMDSITISDAGRYYLCDLIGKIDYLYFMKDDINWPDTAGLHRASVGKSRSQKFQETLVSLGKLAEIEERMLKSLTIKADSIFNSSINIVNVYAHSYSAIRIPDAERSVMFTRYAYNNFMNYIRLVDPGFLSSHFSIIKSLEEKFNAYEDVEKAFLP